MANKGATPRSPRTLDDAERAARTELTESIFRLLDEKKAQNVLVLDLEHVNPYFGVFLIATANSTAHLKSLVRDISKQFGRHLPKGAGVRPDDVSSGWAIIDFIDVVVHLFLKEQRAFYNLERLWGDSNVIMRGPDQPRAQSAESQVWPSDDEADHDDEQADTEDETAYAREDDEPPAPARRAAPKKSATRAPAKKSGAKGAAKSASGRAAKPATRAKKKRG